MPERQFTDVLTEVRRGQCELELTDGLRALVEAVETTGRSGTLTLKLDISPNGKGEAVFVKDTITVKKPQVEGQASIFFIDDEHNLTREDPRQLSFAEIRREGK